MKVLLLLFLCFPIFLFGQKKVHNHEIGIEVTSLWKQVVGSRAFSQNDYYLTYRYYFGGFNLNAGIGGSYSKSFVDESNTSDIDKTSLKIDRELNYRVGIERMKPLRKQLHYFYGAFYTQSFLHEFNNRIQVIQGFARVRVRNVARTGIAPFFGIRYSFTDRIGIETSSMFNFYGEHEQIRQSSRFVGPTAGSPPENFTLKTLTWKWNNQLPIFLILTVRI